MQGTLTRKGGARKPHFSHLSKRFNLRESYAEPQKLRVNREQGIIYGVKVLGRESPNTHGKPVDGTDYLPGAIKSALPLVEGRRVYANHKWPRNSSEDRKIEDRLGKLVNAREERGEAFADLHLVAKHPLAESLMWAAENMPDAFCLSIDADGNGKIENRRLKIDRIIEVRSVDVVAEGGTTTSLSESKQGSQTMTLQKSLKAVGIPQASIVRLFEMYEDSPMLKPDAPADAMPEGGDDMDPKAHLGKAVVALINDETMDPATKKKKIMDILKILDDDKSNSGTTDTTEGDEGDKGDDKGKKKDDDETKVKESLETKIKKLERRDQVRTLCESAGYVPTKTSLAALVALDTDAEVTELIESLKVAPTQSKLNVNSGTGLPRSSGSRVSMTESKAPKNVDEFLARVNRA